MALSRIVVFSAVFLAAAGVEAQVYKCVENGRTVYAERPCAKDAKALDIRDNVTSEQRQEALDSARRQGRVAGAIEQLNEIDAAKQRKVAARAEAADAAKKRRCENLLQQAKDAENESKKWRYHQGLIDDARRRQKEAEDAHFSECYAR